MTRQPRRAFLAGAAGGLAGLAGCSTLPVVGGDESRVEYDGERLRGLADPAAFDAASTYPGPVPAPHAEAHYERSRALLADVPGEPSFPNEAVTTRLADQRAAVAEALSAPPEGDATLDALDEWRYDRGRAAEVRGAYDAASGDASAGDLRERRDLVREELAAFREDWTYQGASAVEAFAVHRHLESLVAECGRYLVPDRPFPADPTAAVSAVGELAGDVERASAAIVDASGLRDAYRTAEMDEYWAEMGTAATRLEAAIHPTRRPVEPYVERDADPGDFRRDVDGTPAQRLFVETWRVAVDGEDRANDARGRGDYATSVAASARTLVALVAMSSVVDAIRDGEYGVPESTAAVVAHRESAIAAVEDAIAAVEGAVGGESGPLGGVVAAPARRALRTAEHSLAERPEYESAGETPDRRDVVRAVGHYAVAEHLAAAVPPVADRVRSELGGRSE